MATETGILHRLRKINQGKRSYPVNEDAYCQYIKAIILGKLLNSLENMVCEVKVPEHIAPRARVAIERTLKLA